MKKKLKKIAFFMPSATKLFYPNEGIEVTGGAEINLYNLAQEMSKDSNSKVSFYVSDDGQASESMHDQIHVKKIKHLNKKKGRFNGITRQLLLVFQILFFGEDIIITTTASEHLGLLVMLHQSVKRKSVLFRMAHDHNYDLEKYRSRGKRFYHLYKYGLTHAKWVVAQTEHQHKELKKININSYIIKNGFDIKVMDLGPKDIVLWVARANASKRPELFLELAQGVPNQKFVMIMPENLMKESVALKLKIDELASKIDNLEMIDYVDPSVIQDYFNRAMAFVNTSSSEGFPNTFIQAGIGCTPIISLIINPDDMFSNYDIGCLCNDNGEKAVDFLMQLNEEKISYYGKNINKYVREQHSLEIAAKEYRSVIEEKS